MQVENNDLGFVLIRVHRRHQRLNCLFQQPAGFPLTLSPSKGGVKKLAATREFRTARFAVPDREAEAPSSASCVSNFSVDVPYCAASCAAIRVWPSNRRATRTPFPALDSSRRLGAGRRSVNAAAVTRGFLPNPTRARYVTPRQYPASRLGGRIAGCARNVTILPARNLLQYTYICGYINVSVGVLTTGVRIWDCPA